MKNKTNTSRLVRGLGAVALAAAVLGSTACSDTALTGFVDDSEIQDSTVVVYAALGIAREHNDILFADGDGWYRLFAVASDEIVHDGNSNFEQRNTLGDFRDRPNSDWFEQVHEAIWASLKVVDLAKDQFPAERFVQSPIVARGWLNAGWSERLLGDYFCEATYQYGPEGGFNLPTLGDRDYDMGLVVGKDTMFSRMAFAMERAIEHADAAIAAGVPNRPEDPTYFDPELIRTSAYAGLAQARIALASLGVDPEANYAAAAAAAAEVPSSHMERIETNSQLRDNENFDISWDNDDFTAWGGIYAGEPWGSPVAYLREGADDPRAQWVECGVFTNNTGNILDVWRDGRASQVVNGPDYTTCRVWTSADDTESELPKWNPQREGWDDEYGDFVLVRGTEMRLIEAEAALARGDLAAFTAAINEARAEWGVSTPITEPTTIGGLEFPNAEDDAWSILDREYLLDGWLDGRRMMHLHRWDHPFVTGNHVNTPHLIDEQAGMANRMACMPLPQNECNLNQEVDCPVLTGS